MMERENAEHVLDLGSIDAFFASDGPLAAKFPNYEQRDEQRAIARAVAEAINARRSLVAEAGTGTGKTLSYLVPAIASGLRVVVSTATKNLQDQLFEKDIPALQRAAGVSFDVELMKGRTNYLCHLRTERFTAQGRLTGVTGGLDAAFHAWLANTTTGDRAELSALPDASTLWPQVTATSDQCRGRQCLHYENCFVTQMRRRAQTAAVILVNHHLYFADIALRQRAGDSTTRLIPAHDLVIFDEAHELDGVAAQHFGTQVTEGRIRDLMNDIATCATACGADTASVGTILHRAEAGAKAIFDALPFHSSPIRLVRGTVDNAVGEKLRRLEELLAGLEAIVDGWEHDDAPALMRRIAAFSGELAFVLRTPKERPSTTRSLGDNKTLDVAVPYRDESVPLEEALAPTPTPTPFVHYTEGRVGQRAITARPIDVAPLMSSALKDAPAIYISATLTVEGTFEHFRSRAGINDADEICVGSPFDYEKSVRLFVPNDLPAAPTAEFTDAAVRRTKELIVLAQGGAFVLCTSHRMVQAMRHGLAELPYTVLFQGDAPKVKLTEHFREDGNAVLVGTMGLWHGVDVAGRALRLVIIDKLPFGSPADPIHQAKIDHLKSLGIEPFMNYQVPQAALTLRQGFGRLMRRCDDTGVVAILDGRLVKKGYGRRFIRSLPPSPRLVSLAEVGQFFAPQPEREHAG